MEDSGFCGQDQTPLGLPTLGRAGAVCSSVGLWRSCAQVPWRWEAFVSQGAGAGRTVKANGRGCARDKQAPTRTHLSTTKLAAHENKTVRSKLGPTQKQHSV